MPADIRISTTTTQAAAATTEEEAFTIAPHAGGNIGRGRQVGRRHLLARLRRRSHRTANETSGEAPLRQQTDTTATNTEDGSSPRCSHVERGLRKTKLPRAPWKHNTLPLRTTTLAPLRRKPSPVRKRTQPRRSNSADGRSPTAAGLLLGAARGTADEDDDVVLSVVAAGYVAILPSFFFLSLSSSSSLC